VLWFLFIGTVLALAGNAYLFMRGEYVKRDLAQMQDNTQAQISKLSEAANSALAENRQRFDTMTDQVKGATSATLQQAKSDVKRTSSQLTQKLEERHQEVVGQLSDLKEATSSKLSQVSTDVEKTGTDLKQVMGDLGIMSGQVATTSKDLQTLKELGDRNYFEFDLSKTNEPQKVGDIRMLLKKTDPKRNRFTLEVYADDKKVEKKDKTINEPVQLYVAGRRQPYEIVVNTVKKNGVTGYLATPKVKLARGQAS